MEDAPPVPAVTGPGSHRSIETAIFNPEDRRPLRDSARNSSLLNHPSIEDFADRHTSSALSHPPSRGQDASHALSPPHQDPNIPDDVLGFEDDLYRGPRRHVPTRKPSGFRVPARTR